MRTPPPTALPLLVLMAMLGSSCAALDARQREVDAQQRAEAAREEEAQGRARAALEANLRRWMGRPSSELVAQWGVPTQTVSLPDRTAVFEYQWVGEELLGANDRTAGARFQHAQQHGNDCWCRERFVVAADGRLSRWTWEGNGCTR